MWLLLLINSFSVANNFSIATVDGFKTEKACIDTGEAVLKNEETHYLRFTCVKEEK